MFTYLFALKLCSLRKLDVLYVYNDNKDSILFYWHEGQHQTLLLHPHKSFEQQLSSPCLFRVFLRVASGSCCLAF